jgi:hypothetical protein
MHKYLAPPLWLTRICLVGLMSCLLSQGCSGLAQRSAVRTIGNIMTTGLPAYLRESDLILAEPSLAMTVKLLEGLLENDPANPTLLLQATQGFASYTYAFVETQIEAARGRDPQQVALHTQRAWHLYGRGLEYGLRRLSQYDPAWKQAASLALDSLTPLLDQLDAEAVPALFWTAFCWGGWLNFEPSMLEAIAALPRLQALLTRLLELDDTYFYGAPHLLQAVQYASRPAMLGGNPRQAFAHFARARAISQGRLLLVPLLEAQYYTVQIQDRARFTQLLQQILDAPDSLFPEQAFLNAVAKQRAALLLRRIDEFFV